MTIQISRNAAGNCITFSGATQPAYWNACLSAQINQTDNTRVDIINDIRSAAQGDIFYEFYAVDFNGFSNADGETFTTAQEMVDYVNTVGNVTGTGTEGINLNSETAVNFRLDQTQTAIFMSTGHQFGVNTIKAVADSDGTIHIQAIGEGVPSDADSTVVEKEHFQKLLHTAVQINGAAVSGGLNDVVNALNELFTVGAFQSVVIADPYSTMVADVGGTLTTGSIVGTHGIDPIGDDIFAASSTGSLNGYKTTETIDQAGEYFTFQIRNRGQIGFGLIASDDTYTNQLYANGSNTTYINPAQFGVGNNAHYGFQFSHWFHPTPNGSWTNYGANTGYVMGPAWSGANTHFEARDEWVAGTPITIRVGINENGYIHIDSLADDGVTWKNHARTSYSVREGSAYHLGIKMGDTTVRLYSQPKVHLLEPAAPIMNFRWIESPDGVYQYPIFATAEEANYYDQNHDGTTGTGTSHQHIFADDPSNTTWYMPDTGRIMNGSTPPQDALHTNFMGAAITYTEITSLTNADLVPPAFTAATLTVDEGSTLNYQTQPVGTAYTTTFSGLEGALGAIIDSGAGILNGTAPEVTGDNVANPSDTYSIGVHRTNSYGTSTGTLTLVVNNLNAPTTAITGFTHDAASATMVDSDTLADGSAVGIDNILEDGNRIVFSSTWMNTYVRDAINAAGAGASIYIGFRKESYPTGDFGAIATNDFDAGYLFQYLNGGNSLYVRRIRNGNIQTNTTYSSFNNDMVFFHDYSVSGRIFTNIISAGNGATTPTPTYTTNTWNPANGNDRTVYIAVTGMTMDIAAAGISEVANPTVGSLTNWTKAVDFSGGSEYAKMVSSATSNLPIAQTSAVTIANYSATNTVALSSGRPWATAVVFQTDGNASNQHIWNQGEGAGSTDDNIYLRTDANRRLYFGWGRDGALNEFLIHPSGAAAGWQMTTGNWYGVYIGFTGERLSGADATAANLVDCFDIRLMGSSDNWATTGKSDTNLMTTADWTSTGGRMDRTVLGDFTIGGRGSNRNFHGKVASFVSTTLKLNVAMPATAEIEMMITDPAQWIQDYKVGQTYRVPNSGTNSTNWQVGSTSSTWYPSNSTQVWLMGDGANDSYNNMIRNRANQGDQNYTKLNLNSMVSNDIETVSIPGLT